MTTTTTNEAIALSSVKGNGWWGEDVPFPFPAKSDHRVRRLVLGSLEEGHAIEVSGETLEGLKTISSHFPNVTHLHLWGISNLEEVDGLPAELQCLDIRKCPALVFVGRTGSALRTLDLADCPALKKLPSGPFNSLREVWLENDEAVDDFAALVPSLEWLDTLVLRGCGGFNDLSAALCGSEAGENVIEDVRAHYRTLRTQSTKVLPECKIVMLGNGGVGKTELVRALKGLPYKGDQKSKSTEGIFLWKWDGSDSPGTEPFVAFPDHDNTPVEINIWDFGGQDLYHNTHRLFLESDAIFVIVWREPHKDAAGKPLPFRPEYPHDPVRPLNYWIDQVKSVRENPQILVVRTGIDENLPAQDWRERVRSEYSGMPSFEVSSKEPSKGDLPGFRDALLDAVKTELHDVRSLKFGLARVKMRHLLAQWQPPMEEDGSYVESERPLLTLEEYRDEYHGIHDALDYDAPQADEMRASLHFYHNIGAVYYPKKWLAEAEVQTSEESASIPVVADQRWVIEGIYDLIRPGAAETALTQARGRVKRELLDSIWEKVRTEQGRPRYDQTARDVIVRFMVSCGLIIETDNGFVFPEFLPDRSLLELEAENDLVVERVVNPSSDDSRSYHIKDRSLGKGFGCLLVGMMARVFHSVRLFRYGGIFQMKTGSRLLGDEAEILVKLEWFRENEEHFEGDIVATLYGPDKRADQEVLAVLNEELRKLPGFSRDLTFDGLESLPLDIAEHGMIPIRDRSVVPKIIRGRIGISMAGSDDHFPNLDFWPLALERNLKAALPGDIEVLCYRSDRERPSVSQLTQALVTSDLMIAFVGWKYLYSEWCMVELFGAARHWKPKNTFDKPRTWQDRIWPVILPDAKNGELARSDDPEVEAKQNLWIDHWIGTAKEYVRSKVDKHGDEETAEAAMVNAEAFASWMWFAKRSREANRNILQSIQDARQTAGVFVPEEPPGGAGDPHRNDWADQKLQPLVECLVVEIGKLTS